MFDNPLTGAVLALVVAGGLIYFIGRSKGWWK